MNENIDGGSDEFPRVLNRFNGSETPALNRKEYLRLISEEKYDESVSRFLNYRRDWRFYYYHALKWLQSLGKKLLGRNM